MAHVQLYATWQSNTDRPKYNIGEATCIKGDMDGLDKTNQSISKLARLFKQL